MPAAWVSVVGRWTFFFFLLGDFDILFVVFLVVFFLLTF